LGGGKVPSSLPFATLIKPHHTQPPTNSLPTYLRQERLGDAEVLRGVLQPCMQGGGGGRGRPFRPGGGEEDEEALLLWGVGVGVWSVLLVRCVCVCV
jgi:hypothetical protein